MNKTPKLTMKERDSYKDKITKDKQKPKKKAPLNFGDLSTSPTALSMTPSRHPNTPKTPSREQPTKFEQPPTAPGETRAMSNNTSQRKNWNPFTYNSQDLPVFSSSNPVDPPRAGANSSFRSSASERSRTSDTERSYYSDAFKIKTLEQCLSLKERYLSMPPAAHADQEPFWSRVLEMLERMPLTKGKFKEWKEAHRAVENWCQVRRSYLKENRLPAVSQAQPELETAIDQWNLVFARRFCKIHSGYFTNTILPEFVEDKLKETVRNEVDGWIANSLKERRDELQRLSQPTFLPSHSSLKDCDNAIKELQTQFKAAQTDESQTRESEVVMSMVLKLQPGLRTAISQYLDGQTGVAGRTEPEGNQHDSEFADSRERIGCNIPSNGPSVRGSAPPASVARQTIPTPPASVPSTAPRSTTSSNNPTAGVKSELFEKSEGNSSKKRKDSDLPNRNTASSRKAESENENIPKTMSHNEAKRPRLDGGPGDVPTAADLRLKGKSYGNNVTEWRGPQMHDKLPPPRSPPWRRNAPTGYRSDGRRSPERSHPPRYDQYRENRPQDHYREGRYQDSYRPPPRAMRETTADFEGMTIQQQNMSLLRQIKRVQDMVEKKN
ncbi:hypothetical protein FPSE_04514 [Fusarium pseudograminearum CS3096]|uniref:Uncharacterized protein n=1 Tax=Fusarium pseudograminearum (strain CS3096) TaxID=1028729 RepID=K3W158_FUSPC|nr:hypothetical protein FPSE_04514 [Fusarium pseudograminearum CS3096]EKJ75325.1 hypothetical protein FPSE_04514 [Fusarium pseudograminearum CS3096]